MRIGCPAFLRRHGVALRDHWRDQSAQLQSAGQTVVLVALDSQVVALAAVQDRLRPHTPSTVQALQQLGWRPEVLSGDSRDVVQRMAEETGIATAHGEVTPEEKLATVSVPDSTGQVTVMVGDGVNDAAALAAADVGIAVHGGAEASLAAADVYLAQPGLEPLAHLIRHARWTMRVVRRNLAVSLGYNVLAVTLAASGLITPLLAAVLMPLSSASVLANAVLGMREHRTTEHTSV